MAKAGLYSGEIVENAPANGAATTKQNGYQWMQYGDTAPPPFIPASTEGIAETQNNNYQPTPSYPHPFEGDVYSEFTMSFVGQAIQNIGTQAAGYVIPFKLISNRTLNFMFSKDGFGNMYINGYLASMSSGNIANPVIIVPDEQQHDWWQVVMSYNGSNATMVAVNLTLGVEHIASDAGTGNIDWLNMVNSTSMCSWGMASWSQALGEPYQAWGGYLSQIYIHNKYIDLTVEGNRRKFSDLDGVVDYGNVGELPLGEQPLVYNVNGHPSSNVGTKSIGTWDTDYWINPSYSIGVPPP